MEAAVHGDVTLLKQAMLHDPLVGAVCNPEEVWQMTDEMLVAQAQWLPQYARQIEAAERRLADPERNGTRVRLRDSSGAARITTKSVEELALDREAARANAAAADKGKMIIGGAEAPHPRGNWLSFGCSSRAQHSSSPPSSTKGESAAMSKPYYLALAETAARGLRRAAAGSVARAAGTRAGQSSCGVWAGAGA